MKDSLRCHKWSGDDDNNGEKTVKECLKVQTEKIYCNGTKTAATGWKKNYPVSQRFI
jgi:hypothetical protein